jgi:hypothetical protein
VSQSSEFCRHNPSCCFSKSNTKGKHIVIDSVRKLWDTRSYISDIKDTETVVTGCLAAKLRLSTTGYENKYVKDAL